MADFAAAQGWLLPKYLRFRNGEEANASGAAWDLPALGAMLKAARRRELTAAMFHPVTDSQSLYKSGVGSRAGAGHCGHAG